MIKASWCSDTAAFLFVTAAFIFGSFIVASRPAMAVQVDSYGCRGDQACVKIAQETQCNAVCQRACREQRYDYTTCYKYGAPSSSFGGAIIGKVTIEKNVLGCSERRSVNL